MNERYGQAQPGDRPLIEFELMPGTSELTGEKVKEIFKNALLGDGTLELDRGPLN